MRLYCLTGFPNSPCLVLKLPRICIMFDCALDLGTLLHYLPISAVPNERLTHLPNWMPSNFGNSSTMTSSVFMPLRECCDQVYIDSCPEVFPPSFDMINISEIDIVLISNYQCMLSLPFITEHPSFRGSVHATDPTVQIGRLLMEELIEYFERCQIDIADPIWKQPDVYREFPGATMDDRIPSQWRKIYTPESMRKSLDSIQLVAYRERIDLYGCAKATAVSSGYCLGSSNWVIDTDYERIVYVSGSSAFTTHPKPMDQQLLRQADIMIVSGLTQNPNANPDAMIGEFYTAVVNTLRAGGNVLVPCNPSGITYDLFECLGIYLDQSGLNSVPLYFISPVAESSLAFANIYAEWLSETKQSKVYLPEEPFPHALMVKTGRLLHFKSVYDGLSESFRSPCIVFAGHPSLRLGDSVHFMEMWRNDSQNAVIFTEPGYLPQDLLGPYQPVAMKSVYCPIDLSLDFAQINKLLKDFKPKRLYTYDEYTKAPNQFPTRTDLCINGLEPNVTNLFTLKRNHVLAIPVQQKYAKLRINPKVAATIDFQEMMNGVYVSPLLGYLSAYNNQYELNELDDSVVNTSSDSGDSGMPKRPPYLVHATPYGTYEIDHLLMQLRQAKFEPRCEWKSSNSCSIYVKDNSVTIEVEPHSTHIVCDETVTDELRYSISDLVLSCLSKV